MYKETYMGERLGPDPEEIEASEGHDEESKPEQSYVDEDGIPTLVFDGYKIKIG